MLFPERLRRFGYDETGRRRNLVPRKHLLRCYGNTPALDKEAVDWWRTHNVDTIICYMKDGRQFRALVKIFVAGAKTIEFPPHGPQYVNPKAWTRLDPAAPLLPL